MKAVFHRKTTKKSRIKRYDFFGARGRTCSFSGDAPLDNYQLSPLPSSGMVHFYREAKQSTRVDWLPPSSPSKYTKNNQKKPYQTIRLFWCSWPDLNRHGISTEGF